MSTLADVYAQARAHLGDYSGDVWTNSVLFPFMQAGYREALRVLRASGLKRFRRQASIVTVAPSVTSVAPATVAADFLRPLEIRERPASSTEKFQNVAYGEGILPEDRTATTKRTVWAWREGAIQTIPATVSTEFKIQYEADLYNVAAGATVNVSSLAGNPVLAQTSTAHGAVTGDVVFVSGCTANLTANGFWTATVVNSTQLYLNEAFSSGSGTNGTLTVYPSTVSLAVPDLLDAVALYTASYAARSRGQAELQALYDQKAQAVAAQIVACEQAVDKAITSRFGDK